VATTVPRHRTPRKIQASVRPPFDRKDFIIMKKCLALLLLLGIAPAWATPKLDGGPFLGEVMESVNAGSYTYLRLKTRDGEVWAATMQSNYPKGTKLQLHDPMLMTNFESRALNRTFDEIVFASAVSTETSNAGSQAQTMTNAHKGAAAATPPVAVMKVAKAPGKTGRTVAEVYAQRAQLKGKPVAVQGTVVKFSGDIMDRNWLHLRDGTGSAESNSNDLIVTTSQKAKVGDVVLVSGVVRIDANYGSGYAYPVVVENATLN
jgi:hypothetical protein